MMVPKRGLEGPFYEFIGIALHFVGIIIDIVLVERCFDEILLDVDHDFHEPFLADAKVRVARERGDAIDDFFDVIDVVRGIGFVEIWHKGRNGVLGR